MYDFVIFHNQGQLGCISPDFEKGISYVLRHALSEGQHRTLLDVVE